MGGHGGSLIKEYKPFRKANQDGGAVISVASKKSAPACRIQAGAGPTIPGSREGRVKCQALSAALRVAAIVAGRSRAAGLMGDVGGIALRAVLRPGQLQHLGVGLGLLPA